MLNTGNKRRKDDKGRVLRDGERRKGNGYEYRWTDRFGKRHSVSAATLNDLRQKESELLKRTDLEISRDVRKMTLNNLYALWKKTKKGIKPNTFQGYQYTYETYVMDTFGNMKIMDLKKSDIKGFYNKLYSQGLKPGTIDGVHTVIHQVLEMAIDDDVIRYNPSDKALKELKMEHADDKKKVKSLTLEEEILFTNYLQTHEKDKNWYPIFIVMVMAGLRVGEATALQWSDIDFENNIINIDKTLVYYANMSDHKCRYTINTTKTPAGKRKVEMIDMVRDALLKEKERQEYLKIECQSNIDGYHDFVFLNKDYRVHNQNSLNRALERIVRNCNEEIIGKSSSPDPVLLPRIHCHMLRHTYGTRLNDAGVNVKAMQEMLGHKDIDTTMRIYVDASENIISHAMDEYEEMISKMFSDAIPQ